MKDILVASRALATYLLISALLTSIKTNLSLLTMNDEYNSFKVPKTSSFCAPIITRSGCIQSAIATPSFKNSGLLAISILISLFKLDSINSLTLKAVPTGTVDLMTINES